MPDTKIQNADVKSSADLGGDDSLLIHDSKIYVTADSLNKTLQAAIQDGDIGGGGGGGINFATPIGDMEDLDDTSNFTSSGGTLSLTTTASEVGRGTKAIKHVATAAAQTFTSNNIPVPNGYRGSRLLFKAVYKSDQERTLTIRDVTNSNDLKVLTLPATGSNWRVIKQEIDVLNSTANMTYELESSAADTFLLDDVIINNDSLSGSTSIQQSLIFDQTGNNLTSGDPIRYNLGTATKVSDGYNLLEAVDNSVDGRTDFTALLDCHITVSFEAQNNAAFGIFDFIRSSDSQRFGRTSQIEGTANRGIAGSGSVYLAAGDSFYIDGIIGGARIDASNQVVTSIFVSAKNETAVSEQIFQENDFNAYVTSAGSVTSETPSLNLGVLKIAGTGNYTLNYSSLGLTEAPSINGNVASAGGGNAIWCQVSNITATSADVRIRDHANVGRDEDFTLDISKLGDDYTPITRNIIASEKPTAFLKDKKTSGTGGGSASADTISTRDLNSPEGDTYFLTLSSNQFTLKGSPSVSKYTIEAFVPANNVNRHQAFLYNVTDSTYDIDGTSEYSTDGDLVNTHSIVSGSMELSSDKTFEIRHWTQGASASTGFGIGAGISANPQANEVYTVVKITKMK